MYFIQAMRNACRTAVSDHKAKVFSVALLAKVAIAPLVPGALSLFVAPPVHAMPTCVSGSALPESETMTEMAGLTRTTVPVSSIHKQHNKQPKTADPFVSRQHPTVTMMAGDMRTARAAL